jgi:hypothetical protein
MKPVKKNPSSSELRVFGLAMLVGFAVIGGLISWRLGVNVAAIVCWVLGLALFLCSLWRPMGQPVYYVWMTGAMYLGAVVTTVLLTALFVVFLPIFSLIRLKDPLRRRLKPTGSYWEEHRPHEPTLERMVRPF